MTEQNTKTVEGGYPQSLVKAAATGALIGSIAISIFVFGVDQPDPAWGKLWRIKPLILTPLAGAFGGVLCYLLIYLSRAGKINRVLAVILSIILFVFIQWIGIVLGLDGTMWN